MNYYQQEDNVPETTEVQLANLRAQQSTLAAVDQYADEALIRIWEQVNTLWIDAGQRQDPITQNKLTETYQEVERLQKSLKVNNHALATVLEAAQVIGKRTEETESRLSELTEAIYDEDTDHPDLARFVRAIETATRAEVNEEVYDVALSNARSEVWDEVSAQIKRLFPKSEWPAIYQFVSALDGQVKMNDIQRGLFLSLIQTFAVDVAAAS